MNKEIDFETYLIISHEKFEIYLKNLKSFENLHQKEFIYQSDSKNRFKSLSEF